MKSSSGIGLAIAAAVTAVLLLAAYPGSAQKKGATASVVGYVDLGLVTDKLKATEEWKVMVRAFEDDRMKYRTEMQDLTKIRYLTAAERGELTNLRAKGKASDAEKARGAELELKSTKMDQEFQGLATVEKPNPTQDARLNELTTTRAKAIDLLKDEEQKRAASLQTKEGELLDAQQKKVLKIVEQVAINKDVSLVVDRQLILFGGQDLTPDVLKKIGG